MKVNLNTVLIISIGMIANVILFFMLFRLEIIMKKTLLSNEIIKIEEGIAVRCTPTEKTVRYLELQKKVKELIEEKQL